MNAFCSFPALYGSSAMPLPIGGRLQLDASGIGLSSDLDELAERVAVSFRHHPHLNNVMTHVSGGRWERITDALRRLFDPETEAASLNRLERNVLDLICAERGPTGRILKRQLVEVVRRSAEPSLLLPHLCRLFLASEARERRCRASGQPIER